MITLCSSHLTFLYLCFSASRTNTQLLSMCLAGAKDRNSLLMAFCTQAYILLSKCFLFLLGFLQKSLAESGPLSKIA